MLHKSTGGWELQESEKIGSAGFVKLELADGTLALNVNLRVVQTVLPEGEKEIRVEQTDGTSIAVGTAQYRSGTLSFSSRKATGAGKTSWKWEELWGIRIELTEGYEAVGKLPGAEKVTRVSEMVEKPEPAPVIERKPQLAPVVERKMKLAPESVQEQAKVEMKEPELPQESVRQEIHAAEQTSMPEKMSEPALETPPQKGKAAPVETLSIPEIPPQYPGKSKWETLLEQYTCVHPFQDERLYLSITPEDFVLLSENDYHLRNNRFLLHGYYNYKHLILGKLPDSTGKEEYYIGVPGLFYEQEKKMAILFGFEGFESRSMRPTDGTFGYYMKRVVL